MKTTEYLSCNELFKSDHVRFYQKIYKQCLKMRSDNYDVFSYTHVLCDDISCYYVYM